MNYLVSLNDALTVVSDNDSTSGISDDFVSVNLGKAGSTHNDSCPLVLVYLILREVRVAVIDNYSVVVVIYSVALNPAEAALNQENALTSRGKDLVVQNDCVLRVVSAQSNVGFEVGVNLVLLNVSTRSFHK